MLYSFKGMCDHEVEVLTPGLQIRRSSEHEQLAGLEKETLFLVLTRAFHIPGWRHSVSRGELIYVSGKFMLLGVRKEKRNEHRLVCDVCKPSTSRGHKGHRMLIKHDRIISSSSSTRKASAADYMKVWTPRPPSVLAAQHFGQRTI